jgi:hypothetical protein
MKNKGKNKEYRCVVSGKVIPPERLEALEMLGIPESRWTCVEHALDLPRKGVYLGENGTSELLIVSKVYNDSVRSVFRSSKKETPATEDAEEPSEEKAAYNEKEFNYYVSDEEQVDPEEKIEIIKRHQD